MQGQLFLDELVKSIGPEGFSLLADERAEQLSAIAFVSALDSIRRGALLATLQAVNALDLDDYWKIRWSQACVGLYPGSENLLANAMSTHEEELTFACLCSLTDLEESSASDHLLGLAMIASSCAPEGSDVPYMAACLFAQYANRPIVKKWLCEEATSFMKDVYLDRQKLLG